MKMRLLSLLILLGAVCGCLSAKRQPYNETLALSNVSAEDAVNLWPFYNGNGTVNYVAWPFVKWSPGCFAVMPLYNYDHGIHDLAVIASAVPEDGEYRLWPVFFRSPKVFYAFPFGKLSEDEFFVAPLTYWDYGKGSPNYTFISPFYSQSYEERDLGTASHGVFQSYGPLWLSGYTSHYTQVKGSADRTRIEWKRYAFPLWWQRVSSENSRNLLFPFFCVTRDDVHQKVITPVGGWGDSAESFYWYCLNAGYKRRQNQTHFWVFPFFFASGNETHQDMYVPILFRWSRKPDAYAWHCLNVGYSRTGDQQESFFLPIWRQWTDADSSNQLCLPLYYAYRDQVRRSVFTPFMGWSATNNDDAAYWYALNVGCARKGEELRSWAYPLWWSWRKGDASSQLLLPIYYAYRYGDTHQLNTPLFGWGYLKDKSYWYGLNMGAAKSAEESRAWFLPLWFRYARADKETHTWTPLSDSCTWLDESGWRCFRLNVGALGVVPFPYAAEHQAAFDRVSVFPLFEQKTTYYTDTRDNTTMRYGARMTYQRSLFGLLSNWKRHHGLPQVQDYPLPLNDYQQGHDFSLLKGFVRHTNLASYDDKNSLVNHMRYMFGWFLYDYDKNTSKNYADTNIFTPLWSWDTLVRGGDCTKRDLGFLFDSFSWSWSQDRSNQEVFNRYSALYGALWQGAFDSNGYVSHSSLFSLLYGYDSNPAKNELKTKLLLGLLYSREKDAHINDRVVLTPFVYRNKTVTGDNGTTREFATPFVSWKHEQAGQKSSREFRFLHGVLGRWEKSSDGFSEHSALLGTLYLHESSPKRTFNAVLLSLLFGYEKTDEKTQYAVLTPFGYNVEKESNGTKRYSFLTPLVYGFEREANGSFRQKSLLGILSDASFDTEKQVGSFGILGYIYRFNLYGDKTRVQTFFPFVQHTSNPETGKRSVSFLHKFIRYESTPTDSHFWFSLIPLW